MEDHVEETLKFHVIGGHRVTSFTVMLHRLKYYNTYRWIGEFGFTVLKDISLESAE